MVKDGLRSQIACYFYSGFVLITYVCHMEQII